MNLMTAYTQKVDDFVNGKSYSRTLRVAMYSIPVIVLITLTILLVMKHWFVASLVLVLVSVSLYKIAWIFLRQWKDKRDNQTPVQIDHPVNDDVMPEPYDERHHVKYFVKRMFGGPIISLLGVILFFLTVTGSIGLPGLDSFALYLALICLLLVLGGMYELYREWWKWNHWRIVGNPDTGQIGFVGPSSPRLLFVRGSPTDFFDMNDYVLYTPVQTFPEFFFFKRSQTLVLLQGNVHNENLTRRDLRRLKNAPPFWADVKDVEKLIAIQQYRLRLVQIEEGRSKSMVELLEEIRDGQNVAISQRKTMIELLAKIANVDVPEPLESTQEIKE